MEFNKNPINILQELCVQHCKEIPIYTFTEIKQQHIITFACNVTAFSRNETANALNKKDAKQKAANEILKKLPNISLSTTLKTISSSSEVKPKKKN